MLDLYIVADRNLKSLPRILPALNPGLRPFDLCLEGIGCLLCFPETL